MGTPPSRARSAKALAVLLLLGNAAPLRGAVPPKCEPRPLVASFTRWSPPLDRSIHINAGQLPLREAIDRISAAAGLRLSYSGNLLPLERSVCVSYRGAALGDILTDLLAGAAVTPVVASLDHVVLAPKPKPTVQADAEPLAVYPLAPLFATANAHARVREPRPSYIVDVIDGEQLVHHATVEDALKTVPGVWTWQSPIGFTAQYGMRGATSFGASSPKVYIDGIEVANPMLATQLLPENIERIEVIRGPQGGAAYGSDALNGVTNIITRHQTVVEGAPRLRVRSGLALSTSKYIDDAGLGQDHLVSLQLGSRAHSGALNFGIANIGEYMPGSYSRNVNLDGNMRMIQERTLITGTARFYSKSAGNPGGFMREAAFDGAELSMQQYTLGAKLVFRQNERFTHSAVLGVDGYALDGFGDDSASAPTVADSVLRAAGNGALRTTLRFSSAARFGNETAATSALATVAAEHSNLQQYAEVRASNGLSAQLDASFLEGAFVTGGVRVQRDEVNGIVATSALPMLSSSYVIGDRGLSLRVRSAYGRAIRWPSMPAGVESGYGRRVARPMLSPEEQTGLEAGVDVTLGGWAGLQVTRYDQTATGLLQSVAEKNSWGTRYMLQSVGEIENNGWEMQAFVHHGALSLAGSMGLVNSRVLRVADGYTGDLGAGDRMLAVPARTMSLQASWQQAVWSASLAATRAMDWINYDRRALAKRPAEVSGINLREFWRRYDGATHLRATLTRTINESLSLMLNGENLLNRQTGEPDNVTVVPGRTISFGVRAAF